MSKDKSPMDTALSGKTRAEIEEYLGGPIEILFLGEECILLNQYARQQHLPKNKDATAAYWKRNPQSGLGADFVLGPAIFTTPAEIAHLDLLYAEPAKVLSQEERMARTKVFTPAEVLQCSFDNPDSCEACGS